MYNIDFYVTFDSKSMTLFFNDDAWYVHSNNTDISRKM